MSLRFIEELPPGLVRFIRFGTVGTLGLVWDTATLYALRPLIGLTAATLAAYFVAASLNWAANRFWTFRDAGRFEHPVLQWLRFLSANSLGFTLNRGTIFLLYFVSPLCVRYPVIALAAGAIAGLAANFTLSRRLVFREKPPESLQELAEITTGLAEPEPIDPSPPSASPPGTH
ncbi:GtrA family protein [Acetobacter sp. AN02]|uniref:GtrA family protein n=1 Tax=Acetobacter sp. AN02 TaxID=2894186 RepID=UPI00243430A4|nr:GtrA family protein [Acetobacter sp. AN02]MDG6094525.1 GtrA family protein [Acetobacter sp. AN02]